jgi:hypothetical protein
MSLETAMAELRAREVEGRVHNFCSLAGNALERIGILIDEGEYDDAKEELADLREALSRIRSEKSDG